LPAEKRGEERARLAGWLAYSLAAGSPNSPLVSAHFGQILFALAAATGGPFRFEIGQ